MEVLTNGVGCQATFYLQDLFDILEIDFVRFIDSIVVGNEAQVTGGITRFELLHAFGNDDIGHDYVYLIIPDGSTAVEPFANDQVSVRNGRQHAVPADFHRDQVSFQSGDGKAWEVGSGGDVLIDGITGQGAQRGEYDIATCTELAVFKIPNSHSTGRIGIGHEHVWRIAKQEVGINSVIVKQFVELVHRNVPLTLKNTVDNMVVGTQLLGYIGFALDDVSLFQLVENSAKALIDNMIGKVAHFCFKMF
jgi:hypothetical protein